MEKGNRIVVDTGVLVSAFAFGGTPRDAVRRAVQESIIIVSPPLLEEYREVPLLLEKKKKINHPQLKALIAGISLHIFAEV
jgi:predicted nucleic acid-binding protein